MKTSSAPRTWRKDRTLQHLALAGLLFGSAAQSSGCASSRRDRAPSTLVSEAVALAERAATWDVVTTEVRRSYASCDAPEWQMWLYGTWVRIGLDGADGVPELQDDASKAPTTLTLRRVREPWFDARGWPYERFAVTRPGATDERLFGERLFGERPKTQR